MLENNQLSTISRRLRQKQKAEAESLAFIQLSTINHQPSTINHQPSTINYQLLTNERN
ncbi:MAG: hypothetical protein DSM107014_13635 [Gomphosphaeria aponina SAG 52.96 = DSM 107014]|uniref:Uncharacterized protein n=1 Tax=Gomphosphaeria aponina SAG 52.96 = DSM 107014 TaxID=1521640 RepID=A0A941GWI1_9CHRO|nr:hypothetical protein [Gomphosphaeria aponina SAG 52.96 = DSM 107014]